MSTQSARITILSTPEFKGWLFEEAEKIGVSVSELVRIRCKNEQSQDEELLGALIKEVRVSTKKAEAYLDQALQTADEVFAEIRKNREGLS